MPAVQLWRQPQDFMIDNALSVQGRVPPTDNSNWAGGVTTVFLGVRPNPDFVPPYIKK